MGLAAKYIFDSADSAKQTLHRRIVPTDTQFEQQQARWNELADYLKPNLQKMSGASIRSWLQGSYKFGTQIRPVHKQDEFDIDLGIFFCWAGLPEDGENGPKALKNMVQESLREFVIENDDVIEVVSPPKKRCCRIRFRDDFHIDVPCYHLDEAQDSRSLATENDVWERSDPKAIYTWFKDLFSNYSRDRTRRLIRYMKTWATLKFPEAEDRPSSALLTVLVAEAVASLKDGLPGSEDEALDEIIRKLSDRVAINQEVKNPVDSTENLACRMTQEAWKSFSDRLKEFSDISKQAVVAKDELLACSIWSGAFEHLFPLPDAQSLEKCETNLPALRSVPEIDVQAVQRNNSNMHYCGVNKIGPIPKDCNIKFRVTNPHAMPTGTQFYWMVRNEGDEAEDANDLGHRAETGLTASEHSAYNGFHYMDCTAISSNQVVGVRRVRVTISDRIGPRRNPPKPAWVKLRGRR